MQVMATGRCESCDERGGEQHHGLPKSSQRMKLNPVLSLDPDLQFDLCPYCHKNAPDAPHVDNEAFLDKMEAKGGHRAFKAAKIRRIDQGPLITVENYNIDYKKELLKLAG
jgi:hypothetical protein